MRRSRNIAIQLALFVVLGAIANVAVAWGCAWVITPESSPQARTAAFEDGLGYRRFKVVVYSGRSAERVVSTWAGSDMHMTMTTVRENRVLSNLSPREVLPLWTRGALPDRADSESKTHLRVVDARGWPCLSLSCIFRRGWLRSSEIRNRQVAGELVSGLRLPDRQVTASLYPTAIIRVAPLRPIWPGFAINTIFYAAALWIVFAAPGFTKRRIRRFRGRCIHCGYDLRGHPPPEAGEAIRCPECGRSA